MNCPRCSAELLDSATFCPQCGTSSRQTGFSYLPAGTPPWPGTLSENASYAATATMPPPQVGDGTATRTNVKPKRSVGSMLLIFVLLVLSIVIGIGGTLGILVASGQFANPATTRSSAVQVLPQSTVNSADTQTPTSTSATPTTQGNQLPTPSSFQVVKLVEVGVSVKYPADWIQDPVQTDTKGSAIDFRPPQQLGIVIFLHRFSSSTSATITSTDQVNQGNIQGLAGAQGLHNLQPTQSATPQRSIGGTQWDQKDASFTNDNGVVFHFTTIAVQHNKFYYDISFYTPDMFYAEASMKYIQPMLDSLKFTP